MERTAKLKNTDIDDDNDVVEYKEIDIAQSISSQPLIKGKEKISRKLIKSRFVTTLIILVLIIVLMVVCSRLNI